MSTLVLIVLMRIFDLLFFVGIAGPVVTVFFSWYSIVKDEFASRKERLRGLPWLRSL
jgi:hypothetical protein